MEQRFRRRLQRRAPTLRPRRRFLILCEGEVTEPGYFEALRVEIRSRLVEIEVVPECGVPKTLVERAVERKRKAAREAGRERDPFLKYDQIWCVFDVDSHPNLAEAKQQAHDNGLKLAVSNPNFELWILLHFQDQFAEQDRKEIRRLLKLHLPRYDKEVPYATLQPLYVEAVKRAKNLQIQQVHRGTPGGNPSTGVYELTETMRMTFN